MKNQHKRGLLASAGALATAAALVLGGAVAATALPTIDPSGEVNLNITKLSTPDGGGVAGDGTQNGSLPAGAEPIEGVEFTVQRVTQYRLTTPGTDPWTVVDLTTNDGWQAAAAIAFNAATGAWTLGGDPITVQFAAAIVGVTDVDGVPCDAAVLPGEQCGAGDLAFQNMDIGLYHVEETGQPAGVTPAVPFIVALPLTNPAGTDWMNTVYVYPKNSQVAFTKSVNDAAAYVPGNTIVYTLNADAPRVQDGSGWFAPTQFTISDTIDTRLTPGAVTVNIVDANGADLGTQPVAGTDYTVTSAGVSPVIVDFIDFDLLETAAATAGAQVRVTITATVGAAPAGAPAPNGDITNGGGTTSLVFTVDGETSTLNPDAVLSKWRSVQFTKVAYEDTDVELAGAVFALFANKANAENNTSPLVTSATTTGDGIVALNNIRVSDFQNGETQNAGARVNPTDADCTIPNPDYRVYWLAETLAPADRELLAQPIAVVIGSDGVISRVALDGSDVPVFGTDCSADLTPLTQIENVAKNAGFQLPLTGGIGTAILTIGGIAILAVVMLLVVRRRRSEIGAE